MIVLDIETNKAHTKIWMVCVKNLNTGVTECHTEVTTLAKVIEQSALVIGQNLIGFDAPVLKRLWKIDIPLTKIFDTLIVSRLLRPDRQGGHSLDSWGTRLGSKKQDYPAMYREWFVETYGAEAEYSPDFPWDSPNLTLMEAYCRQDVNLTGQVYFHLLKEKERTNFSDYSVEVEHKVAAIVAQQERNGVCFDVKAAMLLNAKVSDELNQMTEDLVKQFEPTVIQMKTKVKTIPFNPGSRIQIIDRLIARGWKPTELTEKGNVVLDEDILAAMDIPEAKVFLRYFELQKIASFLKNWLDKVEEDGRIHGTVITNGAVTGRMTHSSPNLGQVPSAKTELGKACRALFIVPEDYCLVGIDAEGLELRMLAHYMQDPAYIEAVSNGDKKAGTDVHSVNQRAVGLKSRDDAKTFIYAYLYGAGDAKIGEIVKGTAKDGKRLKAQFLEATPALKKLREKVAKMAAKGTLPGLDGRRLYVRSEHKALNTLLQGAGALVMKVGLILFTEALERAAIPFKHVLNVHDEWQVETFEEYGEIVGRFGRQAIIDAGKLLNLRCPLDGEYKIGRNWYETH